MEGLCIPCHSWFHPRWAKSVNGGFRMAKLPRFSLSHNDGTGKWELKKEGPGGQVIKKFATKAAATKGGVLERAVGGMGSVRIRLRNGRIQEERTYPRSMDPRGKG